MTITPKKQIPTTTRLYLDHVNDHELLTNEEMAKIAMDYQHGNEDALEELVHGNLRLVIHIAKDVRKKYKSTLDFDDLIQFGNIGLYEACRRFDPTVQSKFSSYAGRWIKHTIERGIENEGSTIRHPVSFYNRKKKYQRHYNRLCHELGREPSMEELSKATQLSETHIKAIQKDSIPTSMDIKIGDDDSASIGDLLADERSDVVREINDTHLISELSVLLKEILDDKHYQVVMMRTGLLDGKKKTLEEVGNIFDLSRERIRQLFQEAMDLLYADQRIQNLKDYLPHDRIQKKSKKEKGKGGK